MWTFTVYRRDTGAYICAIRAKSMTHAYLHIQEKMENPALYTLRMCM
jgi:hypothetical protein